VQFARAPDLAALKARFVEQGVWVRPFGDIVYLTPALTIAPDDLDRLCEAVAHVVRTSADTEAGP
jgi:adenosylmethionine-8-amino-7-oxononanoate aminotransferase